jgi:hypothetical protein
MAGAVSAASVNSPQILWNHGSDRLVERADVNARTATLTLGGKVAWKGDGLYAAKVLLSDPRGKGPQLIFAAIDDGNGGGGAIITFDPHEKTKLNRLAVDEVESVQVRIKGGEPAFDQPFQISNFRSGGHYGSGYATVPVIWQAGHYVLDFKAVGETKFSDQAVGRLKQAVGVQIRAGLAVHSDQKSFGDVAKSLMPMIVSGHADQARSVLDQAWPANTPGKDQLWNDLCAAAAHHPLWRELNMHRLPHADLVEAAGRKGHEYG